MDESVRAGLLQGGLLVLMDTELRGSDTNAFSTIDSAGRENSGDNSSQALSGSGGDHRLWGWVGNVHPSHCFTPELIGLGLNFSLGLLEGKKIEQIFNFIF